MHATDCRSRGIGIPALGCDRAERSTLRPTLRRPPRHGHCGHPAQPVRERRCSATSATYHRTITASHADAQKFFDEGLTLLYGFNHEEAFRSFERAAALDPKAPMPHWGMSLALGTNYNDTATPDRLQQAHHASDARAGAGRQRQRRRARVHRCAREALRRDAERRQAAGARSRRTRRRWARCRSDFPTISMPPRLYAESMMNLRPWKLYTLRWRSRAGHRARSSRRSKA